MNQPPNQAQIKPLSNQRRWLVVAAICALLNALDGYDVLIMSVAAPRLAAEWQIAPGMPCVLLSLETGGMAIGSVILGQFGDRLGRRPMLIVSVAIVTAGMVISTLSRGLVDFGLSRLATGLGLGGILALAPTIAAEFAPEKYRSVAASAVAGSYAVGAFLGGAVAVILVAHDWRLVFLVGAAATGLLLPAIVLLVGESPEFAGSGREGASRLEQSEPGDYSAPTGASTGEPDCRSGIAALFKGARAPITLLLIFAYLTHAITVYFFLKWTPTMVANMGFATGSAGSVLVWSNGGSVLGSILMSLLVRRVQPGYAILATLLIAGSVVAGFGALPANLAILSAMAFVAGLAMSSSISLFYAVLVQSYPAHLRSGAIGFIIGMGRGGAWISPIVAGLLFSLGIGRAQVSAIFGCGAMLAAVAMFLVLLQQKSGSGPSAEQRDSHLQQ